MKMTEIKIPKTLGSCNLIETIVEIRFVPNTSLDSDLWAGILMYKLNDVGYSYHKVPQFNIVQENDSSLKLTIDKDTANSAISLFVNEEDGIRLLIKGNTMLFNCNKGKYKGWNYYFNKIINVLKIIESEEIALYYERTMIRYISEYEYNILQHVKVVVDPNSDKRFAPLEITLTRQEDTMNVYISISGLKERTSKIINEKRRTSLFDVNVFERLTEQANIEMAISSLEKIHKLEKECFFGLLKDDYINTLNPEY